VFVDVANHHQLNINDVELMMVGDIVNVNKEDTKRKLDNVNVNKDGQPKC
jgi:hypothetical protein